MGYRHVVVLEPIKVLVKKYWYWHSNYIRFSIGRFSDINVSTARIININCGCNIIGNVQRSQR